MKKLIDIVDNNVVKEIVFNEQNSKVNGLENEITDTSQLVYQTNYTTDKQNPDRLIGDVDKKYLMLVRY